MPSSFSPRLPSDAGIAIGPILFVLALLGILAAYFASDIGQMGTATRADTITPQLTTQANLIRSKFHECNMVRGGWPTEPVGNLVKDVECPNDPSGLENLWTGARAVALPPPPSGFDAWKYYDYSGSSGGRCVMTKPSSTASTATKQGIAQAFAKFSTQEADYAPAGSNQKFIIWITRPTGAAGANCVAD